MEKSSSRMGGSSGFEFVEEQWPLKMVTVEGSPTVGRIQEEEGSPRFVDGTRFFIWEDSALIRFSEYLGFSTIG